MTQPRSVKLYLGERDTRGVAVVQGGMVTAVGEGTTDIRSATAAPRGSVPSVLRRAKRGRLFCFRGERAIPSFHGLRKEFLLPLHREHFRFLRFHREYFHGVGFLQESTDTVFLSDGAVVQYDANGLKYVTVYNADGSYTVTHYNNWGGIGSIQEYRSNGTVKRETGLFFGRKLACGGIHGFPGV